MLYGLGTANVSKGVKQIKVDIFVVRIYDCFLIHSTKSCGTSKPFDSLPTVEEIIAEGNRVVTRWHLTGTRKGEYLGQAATGNKIAVDGVSIDRIENGMVVSGFDAWNSLGFREQIGLIKKI